MQTVQKDRKRTTVIFKTKNRKTVAEKARTHNGQPLQPRQMSIKESIWNDPLQLCLDELSQVSFHPKSNKHAHLLNPVRAVGSPILWSPL